MTSLLISHRIIFVMLILSTWSAFASEKEVQCIWGVLLRATRSRIGENCVINRRCYLDGRAGIEIGNNVGISPESYILSLTHSIQDPEFRTVKGPVSIQDYVWIGVRAIILPGVHLSEGCVVGAGAVVSKSFPPYKVIAGVPAKVIGDRQPTMNYVLSYFPFFDTDVC